RLVVSSKGRVTPLDYNSPPNDEMTGAAQNSRPAPETPEMTDKTAEKLKSSGWTQLDTTGFLSLVGPLWERVVQGGLLMTFADRACGMTARYVSGRPTLATIQLDVHFVDSGKIGEILLAKPRVVRATRSLIFTTTEVTAGNRCIIMASGVFRILKNESSL